MSLVAVGKTNWSDNSGPRAGAGESGDQVSAENEAAMMIQSSEIRSLRRSVQSYQRAADYVDKILKSAKPADLPMQQATKFEFVINLKAASIELMHLLPFIR